MKVLHVMNDFPYPPNHGGRVDMWGRLQSLVKLGFDVHAVVTLKMRPTEEEIGYVRKLVGRLDLIDRSPNWKGILGALPVQVASRQGLARIKLTDHYRLTLAESEFSFPIFENETLSTDVKVLRIHNNEGRFMSELAGVERNWLKWMYYRMESKRFSTFSPKAFASVDQLWFSSADQYRDYALLHPDNNRKAAWLPPPIDTEALVSPAVKICKQVLFVGGLSVLSNIEAIDWYMSGVHPKLKHIDGYRFVIAGNTRGLPVSPIIQKAAADECCTLYTNVRDLSPLYEQSAVFINCMVRGASIKMKTVNAAEKGLPIVSTAVGNEGTGFINGQHICIADTQDTFVTSIDNLLSSPSAGLEMAKRAQDFLRSRYRHAEQIKSLLEMKSGKGEMAAQ